ncbi:hypothetical protein [Tardiphaga sp. 839_C3_N1_4]|uniref:hypothetical protein n=1 Tax=Tardiphaga sp. 839_C3_N1_4 TaxID=3240761 RepID=UPI003F247EA2
MPYALFSNSVKVSKAFPSKSDVWRHAVESGLVMEVGLGEEDPPRRLLDIGYAIHACAADPVEKSDADATGMSEHDISQMIAACQLNQRSAAAAS